MKIRRTHLPLVERTDPGALRGVRSQISALGSVRSTTPEVAPLQVSRGAAAFTLVEMLLALALLVSLLLALNMFLFSMGELWGQNRRQRLFDQHVRAVTRYLDELLARGALNAEPGRELRVAATPTRRDPALTFDLAGGDRLLPWPGQPLPDVECALSAQSGRGLILFWHSRWETGFKDAPPRALVVSPLVQRLDYVYFDDGTHAWTTTSSPQRDKGDAWLLPARLRLYFQYEKYTASTVITVPPRLAALPAF